MTAFTHVNLRSGDLDATREWYEKYTPLVAQGQLQVGEIGEVLWLQEPDEETGLVFIGVDEQSPVLEGSFAHVGIAFSERSEVDQIAELAKADDCLEREPVDAGPAGYLCVATDPDGNLVEFSVGQELSDFQNYIAENA